MELLGAEALEAPAGPSAAGRPNDASPPRLSAVDRPRSDLFGVPVELAQAAQMLRTILAWKRDGRPHQVMYLNAHVVNQSRELPELAQALSSADLVYCDGAGVRLAARALGLPVPPRIASGDWIWGLAALCESSARSLYLLGGDPPVAREAARRLERWYRRLSIVGAHHGYADLDSPQNQRVIEDINARQPDILLVGMGTPKQQLWAKRCADQLDVDVVWSIGGLLDSIAGRGPRLPGTADICLDNAVLLSRALVEARGHRTASS